MSTPGARECTDVNGNKFKVGDIGGVLIPQFITIQDFGQHGRNIRNLELNPRDVLAVGYPKTGSHWMTSIVTMLMRGSTDCYGQNLNGLFLDRTSIDSGSIPPPDQPRFFFTHVPFDFLPTQVKEKKVKVIYLERNPKDSWVSFYNFMIKLHDFDGTWQHFFDQMLLSGYWYGDWFQFVQQWERDIERETAAGHPIFVNHFEDLKKNPMDQIEKLDQFLGYNRGRAFCEQIAKACIFSTMKEGVLKETDNHPLSLIVYRKGEVGDWKNWFTVAQNERFEQVYSARMKDSKLRYTFELA